MKKMLVQRGSLQQRTLLRSNQQRNGLEQVLGIQKKIHPPKVLRYFLTQKFDVSSQKCQRVRLLI